MIGYVLSFILFAIAAIAIIFAILYKPSHQSRSTGSKVSKRNKTTATHQRDRDNTAKQDEARERDRNRDRDRGKYKQLLGMLNGDRQIADNLANRFGLDKAIQDLIRDRR